MPRRGIFPGFGLTRSSCRAQASLAFTSAAPRGPNKHRISSNSNLNYPHWLEVPVCSMKKFQLALAAAWC